jgi:mono/diheme cytochrome c family protein
MEPMSEGWFPLSQVEAGEEAYTRSCAACHGRDLAGIPGAAPSLRGSALMGSWGDRTVSALFNYIRSNMPAGNAGSLSGEAYIDITAYILAQNDFPVGGEERLVVGSSRLNQLRIAAENKVSSDQ